MILGLKNSSKTTWYIKVAEDEFIPLSDKYEENKEGFMNVDIPNGLNPYLLLRNVSNSLGLEVNSYCIAVPGRGLVVLPENYDLSKLNISYPGEETPKEDNVIELLAPVKKGRGRPRRTVSLY